MLSGKRAVKPIDVSTFLALCDVHRPGAQSTARPQRELVRDTLVSGTRHERPCKLHTMENLEENSEIRDVPRRAHRARAAADCSTTRALLRANPTIRESEIDDRTARRDDPSPRGRRDRIRRRPTNHDPRPQDHVSQAQSMFSSKFP